MTPKFLLPCTAWLTTFHAPQRSDISDLTKRGSTFCLLTRKAKAQDRSFSVKSLTLFTHPKAEAQDQSLLVKNLTLFTHPKGKSSRSIFLNQEPHVVYSPERQKAQDRSFSVKNLSLFTHPKGKSSRSIFLSQEPYVVYSPKKQKLKIDLAYS